MRAELSQADLTDADLVFEVTAKPGRSAVIDSLGMQATEAAVNATLGAFAGSLETHVERFAVLEEVSENCVTVWFRFHASDPRRADNLATGADASVLKYVAHGVLTILNWMDGPSRLRLSDLHQAIRVLAWGTSATSCSRPAVPSSRHLVTAVAAWERVKDVLRESASVRIIMQQGSAELDLTKKVPELAALLDKEVVNRAGEMILVVDRPDYGATGEWLLKHGQSRFAAHCADCDLLERFYRRDLDIRPGDALRCSVQFHTSYGPDYEVIDEQLSVIDVLEVLPAPGTANEAAVDPDKREIKRKTIEPVKDTMLVL